MHRLQDEFAIRSHTFAQEASDKGFLVDIEPVKVPGEVMISALQ